MQGKFLIVEDEPIVALDLQQELQELGCEVTGLAESVDAALLSIEERRPDVALMDIRIDGPLDGIQSARVLRDIYQIPVIFITSYSDQETISRAAHELPYGFLTKPFRSRELHATLSIAMEKALAEAKLRETSGLMSIAVQGMHEATLLISANGTVEFMNHAAEAMMGLRLTDMRGLQISEVLDLTDLHRRNIPLPSGLGGTEVVQEFGWFLRVTGRDRLIVDLTVKPLLLDDGARCGHVITMRNAVERMRHSMIDVSARESECFDDAPLPMVQLDGDGRIMRINRIFLNETHLQPDRLIGRTLTGLLDDPDPSLTTQFVSRLLRPFSAAQIAVAG